MLVKLDTMDFQNAKVFSNFISKLAKINISKTLVCECDQDGTIKCNNDGICECKDNIVGDKCNSCMEGYFKFPNCEGNSDVLVWFWFFNPYVLKFHIECNCSEMGSTSKSCDENGACTCKEMIIGEKCSECIDGYFEYPNCKGFVKI